MVELLLLFFGALAIAIAVTPASKWIAPRVGVVARPRSRDIHTRPVPKLGGLAILLGVLAAALVLGRQMGFQQLASMVIAATVMSFMGLLDDRFGLNPYIKMLIQISAAVLVYVFDVRVQLFSNTFLDMLLTVVWIVGITNAMNFLDNMDGLLAGVSAVISSFCLVLAIMNGQYLVGLLAAAVLGACIGFLVWNFNPATVFMGDSGSMFLGFLLACIAIKLRFVGRDPSVSWMVPVILMGLPIFDTTLVTLSRLRRGRNPLTSPGKDHTSHRIANHGFNRREAVMILYLVCGALGITALIASVADVWASIIIAVALLGLGAFMLWFMEFGPWKLTTIDWESPAAARSNLSLAQASTEETSASQ
ncbi:MAG: undecaprenyl/decaprenyl-phosphate alpha-N-acetylglucosaminyl 1-phosphate transferase [Thermoflexales bacterium]|nr:undecaprenyl/decaprenyl-phosphate alpha-N-acetylglucosaminyl 1-phosphate transferase [Thermoflexales bacterium]